MSLLDDIMGAIEDIQTDEDLLSLRFPDDDDHQGTFVRTQNGREREYFCRFTVIDLSAGNADQIAAAQAVAATQQGAAYTDVRELRVHPAFDEPPEGAVLRGVWDGGRLEVVSRGQESRFTKRSKIFCLLRR